MIDSSLIIDIISRTLEGEKHEDQLMNQVRHLQEVEYEHMDSGMIVFLDHESATVKKFRLTDEQLKETFGQAEHQLMKVQLINETLKIQAETSLHFANGILNRVEIWNALGDYPEDDLENWELKVIEN